LTAKLYTVNGELRTGHPVDQWCKEVEAGMRGLGSEPHPGHQLEKWIKDAGFTNVVHHFLPIPVGPWPKERKFVRHSF
jgi:hypothetical protein